MPIHQIQINEYECRHCGYRWINRINGKNGPTPDRCAKCKRFNWDKKKPMLDEHGNYTNITPEERSLRVRLYKFEGYNPRETLGWGGSVCYRPNTLCQTFLDLKPRPTEKELATALDPLRMRYDLQKHKYYVPNPDEPGWLKYDPKGYDKLLKKEGQKRREYMIQVIKSRGIDYDVKTGLQKDKQNAEERVRWAEKLRKGELFPSIS